MILEIARISVEQVLEFKLPHQSETLGERARAARFGGAPFAARPFKRNPAPGPAGAWYLAECTGVSMCVVGQKHVIDRFADVLNETLK